MGKGTLTGSSCHERRFLLFSLSFRLAATMPCFFSGPALHCVL